MTKKWTSPDAKCTSYLSQAELLHAVERNIIGRHFTGGQIELRQAQRLAHVVAHVRGKEEGKALDAQVALAVLGAGHGMDLRVRVQVANPLHINDDQLVVGALEGEVTEGLRRVAHVHVLHEARVRVVLDVLAVYEVLQVVQGLVGPLLELKDRHLEHVDLLGRIVAVVDLGEEFGVHLHLGVVEVVLAADVFGVHVALGDVVGGVLPGLQVACVRKFFTSKQ